MRINRTALLHTLESVSPGLSPRELIEQSSCFVFKKGLVQTFNDEVTCLAPTPLEEDFTGAVHAKPLLELLRKLEEDELEVSEDDGRILLKGKHKKAGIRMEKKIALPVDTIKQPKDWNDLSPQFTDAIFLVQECAGKDETRFTFTCIHIHPKWIEACDNIQMARYRLKTGLTESVMVRKEAIKHAMSLGVTEYSVNGTWFFLRNPNGLIYGCRRFMETYPDLKNFLVMKGEVASLPKGLQEAALKAQIFSSENADNDQIILDLKEGRVRIRGIGINGWYEETKKISYTGPELSFMISPVLLGELTKKHNACHISESTLGVDGGSWRYVTCVSKLPDKQ